MPRGIGIVRVSQRDDDTGHSPEVQVRAMLKQAADDGFRLDPEDIWDENVTDDGKIRKVSGGAALADRPRLRAAVEAVERGDAQLIVAERFDRFFRDLDVQREVIRRVEAKGGKLVTAAGQISHGTAEQELHANLNGSIAQYQKRTAIERSKAAVQVAIDKGIAPFGRITAGYRRRKDGTLEPDPATKDAVAEAFGLRAGSATVETVWRHLEANGVRLTYSGTYALLRSKVVLGEIHHGKFEPNLSAHEAIVDRDVWDAVQQTRVPSGRKMKSERLLARLGVLRCDSCGSRLAGSTATGATSAGGGGGRKYPIYRCGEKTCSRPVSISAELVEQIVADDVRAAIAGMRGRASAEQDAQAAELAEQRAQDELDAAIRVFSALQDEPVALERLLELREARDATHARAEELRGLTTALTVSGSTDWDMLTFEGRRAVVRAVVARVVVSPGRGTGRVAVERVKPLGE